MLERTKYYHSIVSAVIAAIGIPISQVRFVRNSDYEPTKEFMIDNYRLCALLTQQDTRDTGTEVAGSPMFSPMLTPGLQSLAEEYLGADMQFGGTDQVCSCSCRFLALSNDFDRQLGIFQMAERFLPQLGYRKRAHLMNPMLGSLVGGKMSSSDPAHTKIMFLDGPEAVRRKISGAHCQDGDVTTNGILPILKEILIPISEFRSKRLWRQDQDRIVESSSSFPQTQQHRDHKNNENDIYQPFCSPDAPLGTVFTIEADVENGWDNKKHYKTYAEIEQDFADKRLRPAILKAAVAHTLNRLLAPIREAYARDETWRAVNKLAYPLDPDEVCC